MADNIKDGKAELDESLQYWRHDAEIRFGPIAKLCMPSGNQEKKSSGIGMPDSLLLNEFGSHVWFAFDEIPYQVGSSLTGNVWRDVDVRVMFDDDKWKVYDFGGPEYVHSNGKWVALCLAFSALGRQMTGLPIDFQIQNTTYANEKYKGQRSSLGHVPLRMAKLIEHSDDTAKKAYLG